MGSTDFYPEEAPIRTERVASWRHPFGPDSDCAPDHPVVQVCYADALVYARWAERRLPAEAEWEYAARAGAETTYPWGEDVTPASARALKGGSHLCAPE